MIPSIPMFTVIAVAVYTGGYFIGSRVEASHWQKKALQQEEQQKQVLLDHQKLVTALTNEYQENIYKAEKEKEHAIKTLKFDYDNAVKRINSANGLRVTASICSEVGASTVAKGSSKSDAGTAGTVKLPDEITDNLLSEARRADEIVENYRALQHWVIYQGLYQQ